MIVLKAFFNESGERDYIVEKHDNLRDVFFAD